jgi:hypothetical protein
MTSTRLRTVQEAFADRKAKGTIGTEKDEDRADVLNALTFQGDGEEE